MIHRVAVVCLEILLALVVGTVLAASVVAWRLSEGPIMLDGLKPYVETMLSPPGAGFRTVVGSTEVSWSGWDRALDVVARDVAVIEPNGAVRARIDSVAVALSARALLAGRLAPKRVNVLEPRITVLRTVEGRWHLMPDSGADTEAEADFDLAGLLKAFSGTGADDPLSDLLEIDVSGARIRLVDDQRGLALAAHGVSAGLLRAADGLAFHGGGTVDWEGDRSTPFELHGGYRRSEGTIQAQAQLTALPVDALASLHPSLAKLEGLAFTATGDIRVMTGVTGDGLSGAADFTIGAGSLAVPGFIDKPVPLSGGTMQATVEPGMEAADVSGTLDLGGPKLTLSATAVRAGSGYGLTVDGAADAVPVDDLARYWPETVGPPAREWVTENLTGGVVPHATVKVDAWLDPAEFGSLRVDKLGGRIDFHGVTTHYFRPLPPVVGVSGTAVYDADSFDIALKEGHLDKLSLDPSRVRISGLEAANEFADVEVAVRGPLSDALHVLDHKPLGYPSRLGIDIANVAGQTGARLRFEFPLLKTLSLDQIKLAAAANLAGVRLPGVVAGQTLDSADLTLDLTGAGMKLSGTGKVLGADAKVTLDQRFHKRGPYTSRSWIKTTATRERLAAFGLDLGDVIGGRMGIEVDSEVRPDGVQTVRITGDLQDTSLDLSALGWSKPAGSSGVVRARMTVRNGVPVSIDAFDIMAGDLAAQAVASLGPKSQLKVVDFARLRIGRTDAAGRIERLDNGEWRIALRGPTIDLSPILGGDDKATPQAEESGRKSDGDKLAIDLRLAADSIVLSDTATLTRATLAARRIGKRLEALDLRGRIGAGYATVMVQPTDGERRLTLRAEDAGEFLRAFDIVDTIQGGRLGVDGHLTADGLDDGVVATARLEEFHVVDAPVLAQVLSVASLTGLADTLSGDGIRFARARVDLTITPQRIEARDGIAYGPGLGLKIEGAYDRKSELMDFVGLVAPAYSLSRLIDKIPVFGELLTGGEGEGLLATEFRVRGTFKDPRVTVNPLTALAPGFLRDLLTTAERPADAPVVEPPPPVKVQKSGPREDLGR